MWHCAVLQAALATTPSPIVVAAVARTAGRLSHRYEARNVLTAGALLWTAGLTLSTAVVGTAPNWAARWLPAALLTGLGVGRTLPPPSAVTAPGTRYKSVSSENCHHRGGSRRDIGLRWLYRAVVGSGPLRVGASAG